ncbi:MAG: epoxyqueuosine reductase [Cellvibrionaceae bacterium]|jgi:epoxyqueuosine reductase
MVDQDLLFQQSAEKLSQQGLNLCAVFDLTQLPESVFEVLRATQINLDNYSRLVMLGNGGKLFWHALAQSEQRQVDNVGVGPSDPIDRFSLHLTQVMIDEISSSSAGRQLILYPQTEHFIPLQQLGELAGWGTPSPIGNSISAEYGLWFAFRSAFLTSIPLLPSQFEHQPSPCLTCISKPCQTACPAGAVVDTAAGFKLDACIDHRLKEKSPCVFHCLARQACPIGIEHQYPEPAVKQLYGASLSAIQIWQNRSRK